MAFDKHNNFAYSVIATAPSPATSGLSLVVSAGDGTKFPTTPFNATIWPVNTQPTKANAEIVRVTAISTDTFTIVRTQESTTARTVIVGDQIAAGITVKTITDIETPLKNIIFNYVASGCVWTADSAGLSLNGSMTSGVVIIAGVPLTVNAVSAHAFTASKDTYVDFVDSKDGTAKIIYTEVTNNAASPSTLSDSSTFSDVLNIRNAIIVSGLTIAAATSINQGQETMVLPIASSIPYAVTDSLGNLINPTDPFRKLLGLRQIIADFSTASTTAVDVTGINMFVNIPSGRKIKATMSGAQGYNAGGGINKYNFVDVTASNTTIYNPNQNPGNTAAQPQEISTVLTPPSSGYRNYKLQAFVSTGTLHTASVSQSTALQFRIELE